MLFILKGTLKMPHRSTNYQVPLFGQKPPV